MSRLLITGPGHSGGNWVTEICRATGNYNFTQVLEDRNILYREKLPEGYATKITTDFPGINWLSFYGLLEKYDDLKIIFTFRHPLDNCLSKIARGMPIEGNEPFSSLIDFSYEATSYGSIKSVECAYVTYSTLRVSRFSDRIIGVKLEDLIKNEEIVIRELCEFIEVDYKDEYCNGYARTNNRWQIKRYDRKLDTSQIDMYKRWDSIYDGFYKDKKEVVNLLAYLCKFSIEALGYTYEGV